MLLYSHQCSGFATCQNFDVFGVVADGLRVEMMRNTMCVVTGVAFALGGAFVAQADLAPVHVGWYGPRAAGMGGISISLADDEWAVLGNPAGIGRQDDDKQMLRALGFPNILAGGDDSSRALLENVLANGPGGDDQIESTLRDVRDQDAAWGYFGFFPHLVVGRFAFGLLGEAEATCVASRLQSPLPSRYATSEDPIVYDATAAVRLDAQVAPIVGLSFPARLSGFELGVSARYAVRHSLEKDLEVSDNTIRQESDGFADGWVKMHGPAFDVGALWSRDRSPWIPQVALVWRDVGNSVYRTWDGTGRQEVVQGNIVFGLGWEPMKRNRGSLRLVAGVEAHHLIDERVQWRDRFRLGGEIRWNQYPITSPFAFRLGHNLRGFSYGVGVDLYFFHVDFGSYVEAVESMQGVVLDRRNLLRLTVDLRV